MSAESTSSARRGDWAPHLWEGCDALAWSRMLWRNRFAVHPSKWYVAAVVTPVSVAHSLLKLVHAVTHGRRLARTEIGAPLFILGHWRQGTTLLHELLIQDRRHGFPNTYHCFEPNHPLLTERLVTRGLPWLLPNRRPMDNMAAGWDRPQEDEFALCLMGVPSPYGHFAFPNRPMLDQEYLDFAGVSRRDRDRWKSAFSRFLKQVAYRNPGRRLVLKSPTHTARIPTLLEMFPDARFVHIVRDPFVVFPSTVNLWKAFYRKHGLQVPTCEGLEEYVMRTYLRVYERLEEGRKLVRPGRFHELKYEELVRDPVGEMSKVYEALELGDFAPAAAGVAAYVAATKGYETNKYEMSAERRADVAGRWGAVIRRYGYGRS